jgi:S-adenosylmethionine/arginine decarboxylase-like enzyme
MTLVSVHLIRDYRWKHTNFNNKYLANHLYEIMNNILEESSLKIAAKSLVILPLKRNDKTQNELDDADVVNHADDADGDAEGEGFTWFFSLTHSHCSGHCYFKHQILTVDIATCGNTNTFKILDEFEMKLSEMNGSFIKVWGDELTRVHSKTK